jgi:hypothetical protein
MEEAYMPVRFDKGLDPVDLSKGYFLTTWLLTVHPKSSN